MQISLSRPNMMESTLDFEPDSLELMPLPMPTMITTRKKTIVMMMLMMMATPSCEK